MNLRNDLQRAEIVPVVFYEDCRIVLEQLLQAAVGTVFVQVGVHAVDVLNSGGEAGPL